ncbi:MAG TPA: 4Fe-4S binding protein [Bacteroidales bacterium]|nr:4Fe-4S binding protein [Bacteroidales bacterium]HRZ49523.1 4Fe-4S binding protein [Bacteroidales bacterium]
MKRDIIKIDDDLCTGCGLCIPNCHEGALQIIDGKVRLVSELMCDGLGACIGHCPEGAITIEQREAVPYDEVLTIKEMIPKGKNTIIAHLKHMKDYRQTEFLKQGVTYLYENRDSVPFDVEAVLREVHAHQVPGGHSHHHGEHQQHIPVKEVASQPKGCGCAGSAPVDLTKVVTAPGESVQQGDVSSALGNWPVQMHLINPAAGYFKRADLLVAADCVAFAAGNFHAEYLKGKTLVIACPKLDDGKEVYVEKLRRLIDEAGVNTITVMMMEVPCCSGLLQLVQAALASATRKVPVKMMIIGIRGELLQEQWV